MNEVSHTLEQIDVKMTDLVINIQLKANNNICWSEYVRMLADGKQRLLRSIRFFTNTQHWL